jgi:acylphosphatase
VNINRNIIKRIIALVVLLAVQIVAHGQDPREIINRYLDAVSNGTIDHWNKIRSIYTESESYYSQNDFEHKVDLLKPDKSDFMRSFSVLPYNQKIEHYDDSTFTKPLSTFYFLKDKIVILIGNIPPMTREPLPRDEFFSAHLPVQISKLMDKSRSIELLRIKEFPGGLSCYEIKMITKERPYVLYINTETFLLEYWNNQEDGDLSILAKFYNYRKVEDLLIPMSDCAMKNGVIYSWNNIRKYQINPDIDPKIFDYKDQ